MYLLKYLSQCGICSRRKAVDLIKSGVVRVNGNVVTMPYTTINPASDEIVYQGRVLKPQEHVYFLLNKPEGYITTCSDTSGRKTVLALLKGATSERIYPVGRLDRETTGLLLFTNDGTLAQKLSHPSNEVVKVYKVFLDKRLRRLDCKKLLDGIMLEDGFMKVDSCSYDDPGNARSVVVKIHSGKNRIVRRLFAALWYKVEKLDRVGYAGLTKRKLAVGSWRRLNRSEVMALKKL